LAFDKSERAALEEAWARQDLGKKKGARKLENQLFRGASFCFADLSENPWFTYSSR
jgi:hypothetical protein